MKSKGKIYWIEDDFSYIGFNEDWAGAHSVSRVESAIIQEHMIQIHTEPTDFGDGKKTYMINLLPDETGKKFKGSYRVAEVPNETGEAEVELFENKTAYFLHGIWHEEDVLFTWFVKIFK